MGKVGAADRIACQVQRIPGRVAETDLARRTVRAGDVMLDLDGVVADRQGLVAGLRLIVVERQHHLILVRAHRGETCIDGRIESVFNLDDGTVQSGSVA